MTQPNQVFRPNQKLYLAPLSSRYENPPTVV
ncbi:hypothetical protein COLO4_00115 [Corchorus olitorius]|uniref:Uncharacterized protein n=1 Tax=Corchorus olitorius TaxID=93759 RepID=A0A1R3L4N4_9ROSI|nr:hypothetical protein COLO4_00115 [Corchorus olitorius]